VVTIAAAPPFDLSVIGAAGSVSSLGVSQYAAGRGASPVPTAAPARLTVVSSDTTRLAVEPATVGLGPGQSQADGFRLLGRAAGSATLTPYVCDVPGPAVAMIVTVATVLSLLLSWYNGVVAGPVERFATAQVRLLSGIVVLLPWAGAHSCSCR
jgi:hypothetical protein